MLLILLPRNPHLMKRPQTRQNTPPNPTPKPPLHRIPTRTDPDLRPRIRSPQLLLQSFSEAREERTSPRQDDVGEHDGADVDVDVRERGLDERDDGLGG